MKTRYLYALMACLAFSVGAAARAPPPQRLVLELRPGAAVLSAPAPHGDPAHSRESALALSSARALSGAATYVRATAAGAHVVQLPLGTGADEARDLAARLQAHDPAIERAEVDHLMQSHDEAVPAPASAYPPGSADAYAHHQWPLMVREPGRTGRANFHPAWTRTPGADDIVVAVLDSGTTHHPDTASREYGGYDLVSDATVAADGDERDADPSDPGNFCATGIGDSDWHGTAVAGLIGAIANNGYAIAGAAHGTRLQHLRVLGRCGAWSSDVADAIAWAAGLAVPGLPRNATPARVLNISLGAPVSSCSDFMQAAVDQAVGQGVVVVASAGNEGLARLNMPANCRGVVSVAAGTESGDLAHYSNHSPAVTLTAPAGGECRQQESSCIPYGAATVGTVGPTLFEYHTEARYFGGTSAAAPHVAAAAALMLSVNPALTPFEVAGILRETAYRDHPADSFCAAGNHCGGGFLDAQAAVTAAQGSVAPVVDEPAPPGDGGTGAAAPAVVPTAPTGPAAPTAPSAELQANESGGGAMSPAWLALLLLAAGLLGARPNQA